MSLVLVVDDEPDIRDLIRINLEGAGHRVVTAANGAEALAAVRAERPDAILLDLMMPGTDGWTVLENLKADDDALASVPVLMVTALTQTEDRLRGAIEGAIRYITKPFDPRDLVLALREVLDVDAPPEAEQRRLGRQAALTALARIEARGHDGLDPHDDEPRVRLTRLEQEPIPPPPPNHDTTSARLVHLTEKQRELLDLLHETGSVTATAARLTTSRSNVYASLRRVVHRLGLRSTTELLRLVQHGDLRGE